MRLGGVEAWKRGLSGFGGMLQILHAPWLSLLALL